MKCSLRTLVLFAFVFTTGNLLAEHPASSPVATAPENATGGAQAVVPRLIKFSGTLLSLAGKPITGPVDVTFSLYSEEAGGNALWFETQTVQADALGHYTALLGAMTPTGVPMDLFTSGEAHWLGVQVSNLPEQSRVLLVSVPYAMKAGDAETLGGKPASAYALTSQSASDAATAGAAAGSLSGLITKGSTTTTTTSESAVTNAITASYVPVFTDGSGTLANSILFQSGSKIGINTNAPAFNLDLNGAAFAIGPKTAHPGAGGTMRFRDDTGTQRWLFGIPGTAGSQDFQMYNYANGHAPIYIENGAHSYSLYFDSFGDVGMGTNSPAYSLDVNGNTLGVGTKTPVPGAGGSVRFRDDTGSERWAMGIPGSAGATDFFLLNMANSHQPLYIHAAAPSNSLVVNASGDLGVGTANPGHTLDVNGDINAGSNVTSAGTVSANAFSGNGSGLTNLNAGNLTGTLPSASFSGAYSAAVTLSNPSNSFTGNGSGLTSLTGANVTGTVPSATSATSAASASNLVCSGCVSSSEVNFNYAGSSSKGGAATSALTASTASTATTAGNATNLGGVAAGNYARKDTGNSFTGDQAITGNMTVSGTLNGMVIIASKTSGDSTSANMLGGYTGLSGSSSSVSAEGAVKNTVLPGGNTIADGVVGGTISGGGGVLNGIAYPNSVTNNWGTVAGGRYNRTGDGTDPSTSFNCCQVISGGWNNEATLVGTTIGGGWQNHATGDFASVPGGYYNQAQGWTTFAAGCFAIAANDGSFVWSGNVVASLQSCIHLSSGTAGQFVANAPGGFWLGNTTTSPTTATQTSGRFLQTTTGAYLSTSGTWTNNSDRNLKTSFEEFDQNNLLILIGQLPITKWRYNVDPDSIRHIGPMAQDFYAAFKVGNDDKHISTVDEGGVALAGVQALYRRGLEKDKKIRSLERSLGEKEKEIQTMKREIKELRKAQEQMALAVARLDSRLQEDANVEAAELEQ